ncbi:MAG TPA: hypothetical protein DCM51_02865 [Actinobacteria bacterium]|nr:hypothetical protein [Actinomycetota bacterium]
MTGILDKLPPAARHFLLMLLAAALTTALAHQDVILQNVPAALVPLAGAALTILATAVTPFTAQYGFGSGAASTTFPDTPGDEQSGS